MTSLPFFRRRKLMATAVATTDTTVTTVTTTKSGNPGITSSIEDRALSLLGQGISSEIVASTLGVTPARISQLLADPIFASQVTELRYEALQVHNKRDDSYDKIEDKLLIKLEAAIPLMFKPETVLSAIKVVNAAKRRGTTSPEAISTTNNIVQLILPKKIINQFTTNVNNQVTKVGNQTLVTMQAGELLKKVEPKEVISHETIQQQAQPQLEYTKEPAREEKATYKHRS